VAHNEDFLPTRSTGYRIGAVTGATEIGLFAPGRARSRNPTRYAAMKPVRVLLAYGRCGILSVPPVSGVTEHGQQGI
jgi:hypothetical protein